MTIGFHLDDIEEAYFKNNMADDKPIGGLSNCDMPLPRGFGKQEGWICPVCGRGLSPWTSFCPCQSDMKITYGTSTNHGEEFNNVDSELERLFKLNDERVAEIISFYEEHGK